MYTLTQREANGLQFLEMTNPQNNSMATFCLDQGGRLSRLVFNGVDVLANFSSATYDQNYASSILFPFANRIKNGQYTFEGVDYELWCNDTDKNNALHGLVYDKTFKCTNSTLTSDYGSIELRYQYDDPCKGFPFKFDILLTYTLRDMNFELSVEISNTGEKKLPFTLGWHPYFASKDLNESILDFASDTKFLCDRQQVISGTAPLGITMPYQLKDVTLDDGYKLNNNTVAFSTPQYRLHMTSSAHDNYLQLYTPDTPNVIAIEPMTGAADSFNNQLGLQTLAPHESYNVKWSLTFENHTKIETTNN